MISANFCISLDTFPVANEGIKTLDLNLLSTEWLVGSAMQVNAGRDQGPDLQNNLRKNPKVIISFS